MTHERRERETDRKIARERDREREHNNRGTLKSFKFARANCISELSTIQSEGSKSTKTFLVLIEDTVFDCGAGHSAEQERETEGGKKK